MYAPPISIDPDPHSVFRLLLPARGDASNKRNPLFTRRRAAGIKEYMLFNRAPALHPDPSYSCATTGPVFSNKDFNRMFRQGGIYMRIPLEMMKTGLDGSGNPWCGAALPLERLEQTYWAGWTGVAFHHPLNTLVRRLARTIPVDSEKGIFSSLALAAAVLKRRKSRCPSALPCHGRKRCAWLSGSRSTPVCWPEKGMHCCGKESLKASMPEWRNFGNNYSPVSHD